MPVENSKYPQSEIEPEAISRLLSRYVAEIQGQGASSHLWVLFALDDIATYCGEHGFDNACQAIHSVLWCIDGDIVAASMN